MFNVGYNYISFCRCFLIFNSVVFCVDDGVILWLKMLNPTFTTKCYANGQRYGPYFVSLI